MVDWLNISDDTPRRAYIATAAQTVFTFPFQFFEEANLVVYVDDVLQVLATDYTTSGVLVEAGGSVTFSTPMTGGESVVISCILVYERTTHIPPSGPLDIPAINIQFSKLVAMIKQIDADRVRVLIQPTSDVEDFDPLPIASLRANKFLGFDSDGQPMMSTAVTGVTVSAFGLTLIDDANAAAARTTLGLNASAFILTLIDDANAAAARATLGAAPITVLSAKDFGAVGDGVADDTAALQAAINFAMAATSVSRLYLPRGTYKITTALSITSQMTLVGDGCSMSIIQPAVNINGININCLAPVKIEDIGVYYPSAANANKVAIQVTGPSGAGNSSSVFSDIQILNCTVGISFVAAVAFVVDNAKIQLFSSAGIVVQNTLNVDAGDSIITNCYIQGSAGALAGIQWLSSGALRIIGTTVLTVQYGLLADLSSAAVTRQMIVSGNSFDGCSVAGVALSRLGATGTFGGVLIASNILNLCKYGVSVAVDGSGAWLDGLNIIGNNYYDDGTAGCYFANINSCSNVVIAYNTAHSTVATTTNILTGASVTSAVVGPNMKTGTFAANSIAGTSVTTIAPN